MRLRTGLLLAVLLCLISGSPAPGLPPQQTAVKAADGFELHLRSRDLKTGEATATVEARRSGQGRDRGYRHVELPPLSDGRSARGGDGAADEPGAGVCPQARHDGDLGADRRG